MSLQTIPHEYVAGMQRTSRSFYMLPGASGARKPIINQPESRLVGFCEALFQMARQYRDTQLGMKDRWEGYRSWLLHSANTYWYGQLKNQTTFNIIHEKIEHLSAQLTDGDPRLLVLPESKGDVPFTRFANDAISYLWNTQGWDTLYYDTVHATLTYGTWYWKVGYDPQYGALGGMFFLKPVPAWYVFPAPFALNPQSAPWMIECMMRTPGEILNDYGVEVDPELGIRDIFTPVEDFLRHVPASATTQTAAGPTGSGQLGGEVVPAIPTGFMSPYGPNEGMVLQKELWIRDGATTPQYWFQHFEDGASELRRTHTLKYPKGRVISWANGRLLYDRHHPYNHGRFPYVKFYDIPIHDFWYGQGETEQLVQIQLKHNDTHDVMALVHLYSALGRLIVDESTGLTEGSMSNEPGEIWFTRPGTYERIRWLEGSQVPREAYSYLALLEKSADGATGSHDVTRGINPTGVTAGKALIALRNAANVRIRARHKGQKKALGEAARQLVSLFQQFAPRELTLSLLGRDERGLLDAQMVQFRDFHMSEEARRANFNIRVEPGTNEQEVKAAEFERVFMLYQLGLMTPEHLIESTDLHDKEAILADLPALMARRSAQENAAATQGLAAA